MLVACALCPAAEVLGKLGQSTASSRIYASTSSRSRVYYHLKAYEYLVVQKTQSANWLRVLLQNGIYGYVSSASVVMLPYDVTSDRPTSRTGPTIAARSGSSLAQYSLNFVGTPYVWGGNDSRAGVDCSGFVKEMYGAIGVHLPRTAAEQVNVGQPILKLEDLQPGDRLYFWEAKRGKVGHTGIYLGRGYFVPSSRGKGGVATDYLGAPKWLKIVVAARR